MMKLKKQIKKEIIFHADKCTGCHICELMCSFTYLKRFSPNKAFIQIINEYELVPQIKFKNECNRCGICVYYCLYGALELREVES